MMWNPTILLFSSFSFFRCNNKNNDIINIFFLSLLLSVSACFLFSSSSSSWFIVFSLAQQLPSPPTYQSTDLIVTSCPSSPYDNYIFENDAKLILKFDGTSNLTNCPNLIFRNIINVSQIVVRKSSKISNSSILLDNITCSSQSDVAVATPFCISFEDSVIWEKSRSIVIKNVHREVFDVQSNKNASSQSSNNNVVGGVVYFSNISYFNHIETLHIENIRLRRVNFSNNNTVSSGQQSCNFAVVVLGVLLNISNVEIIDVFLGDGGWKAQSNNYYDPEYYLQQRDIISPVNSIINSSHLPCSFFVVSLPAPIIEVRKLRINRVAAQNMFLQNRNEIGDASSNFMQIAAVQLFTPESDGLDNNFYESLPNYIKYTSVEISQIHLENISLQVNSTSYRIGGIKSDAILIGAGITNVDNITIADVTFTNISVNHTQQDGVVVCVSGVRFAPQVNISYRRDGGSVNNNNNSRLLSVQRVLVENVILNLQSDVISFVRGLLFETASLIENYHQTIEFNTIQVSKIMQLDSKLSSSEVPKQIDISGIAVDGMFEGAKSLLISNILVSSITQIATSESLSVKSCSFRMEIPSNGPTTIKQGTFVELAQMENVSISSLRNLTSFGGNLIVAALSFEGETSFFGSSSSSSSSSFIVKNISISDVYDSQGSNKFALWFLGVWFGKTVAEFGNFSSLMSFRDISIKDCVNSGSTDGKALVSAFYSESTSPFFGNGGNNNNNQDFLYSSSAKFEISNILVSNWKERSDGNGNANTIRFMAVFLQSGVANFTEMYFGDFVIEGLHLIDASSNTADNVLRVGSLIFGRFDFVIDAGSKNALLLGQNNKNNNNSASLTISNITHSNIFLKTEHYKQKIVFNAVAVDAQVLNFALVNVSGIIVKNPLLFDATAYNDGTDTSDSYVVRFSQNITAASSNSSVFSVSNCGFFSSSSENADFQSSTSNNINNNNQGIIFATGSSSAKFVVVGFSNNTDNDVFLAGFSSVVISDIFFSANSFPSSFNINSSSRKSSLRFYLGVPSVNGIVFVYVSVFLVEINFNLIGNNSNNNNYIEHREAALFNLRIHNVTLLGPIFSYEESVALQVYLVLWRCPSVRGFNGIEMSNILAQNVASHRTPAFLFFASVQIGIEYPPPVGPRVLFDASSNSQIALPSSFKLSNCSIVNVDFKSQQPFIFNLNVLTSATIKHFDQVVFENLFIGGWKSVDGDEDGHDNTNSNNNNNNPEFSFGLSPPTFRLVSITSVIQLINCMWNDGSIIANLNSATKNPTTIIFRNFLIRHIDLLDSSDQIAVYGVSLTSKIVGAPVFQNYDHVLIERIRILDLGTITSTSTFNLLTPCLISKASVWGSGKIITTSPESSSSSFGSTFIIRNVKLAHVALIVSAQVVAMFSLQLVTGQFRYFQSISISNISLTDVQQATGTCTLLAVFFSGIAIIGQVQTSSSSSLSSPLIIFNISIEGIVASTKENDGNLPVVAAMFAAGGQYSYFTSIAFINFLLSNISVTAEGKADFYTLCIDNNYKINNIGINNNNNNDNNSNNNNMLSNVIKFSTIRLANAVVNVSSSTAAATVSALYFGTSTTPIGSPTLFEISHVKVNLVKITALFSAQIIGVGFETVTVVMTSSSATSALSLFRIDDVEMSNIFANITSPNLGAAVMGIEFFQSVAPSGVALANFTIVEINNIKIHNNLTIVSVGSSSNSVAGIILANMLGKSSPSSPSTQFVASNILVSDVSIDATGEGPCFIQAVYATYSEVNLSQSRYMYLDSHELSNVSFQNIWIRSSSYIEVTSINSQIIEFSGNTPIILNTANNNTNSAVTVAYKNISIREISTAAVTRGEKTIIGVVTGNGGLFISAPIMKYDDIVIEKISVNETNKSTTKSSDIFICLLTASRMKKSLSLTNILVNTTSATSTILNRTRINNEGKVVVAKIRKDNDAVNNTIVHNQSSLLQILVSRVKFISDLSSCSSRSPQNCSILGLGDGLLLRANVDFRENFIEGDSPSPCFVVLGGSASLASRNTENPDSTFTFEGNSVVSFANNHVNNYPQQQPSLVFAPSISTSSSSSANNTNNTIAPFVEMNSSQWILRCNNWPRRLDREFKELVETQNPEAGQQVHLDCVSSSKSLSISKNTKTSSSSATVGSSSHSKSASPVDSPSPSQTLGTGTKSVSTDVSTSKSVSLNSSPTLSNAETKTRTHQLPPPPYVPPYRKVYEALATASSFLQLTAAASAASAIRNRGVLSSLTKIMTQNCGIDDDSSREMIFDTRPDAASSPTQMYFGFGNGGWLAGTVVGNCALLVGIVLVQVGGYCVFFSAAKKSQEKTQDLKDQGIREGKKNGKVDKRTMRKKKKIQKPNWSRLFIQSKTHHTLAIVGTMLLDPTLLATCYLLAVVGVEVDIFWKVAGSLLGFGGFLLVGILFVTTKYVLFRKPIERFVPCKKASSWNVDDEENGNGNDDYDEDEENDEDSIREKLLDKSGIRRFFDYFMSEEGEWKCPKKGQIILQSDDDDDEAVEMSQVRNKKNNNAMQHMYIRNRKRTKKVRSHHIAAFEFASPLIEPYTNRFRQFFIVDLVVVLCIMIAEMVGVITGSCLAQGIILIVAIGIFAILILKYRPLQERFLRVVVPFISIVQCVVLGIALYLSSNSDVETSDLDTVAVLALVLSTLQLVVATVSVFPPLLGILDILVIKWKLRKIKQREKQEKENDDSELVLMIENPNKKKLKKRRRIVRRKLQGKTSKSSINLTDLETEMANNTNNSTPLLLMTSINTSTQSENYKISDNEKSEKKRKKKTKTVTKKDNTNTLLDDFSL